MPTATANPYLTGLVEQRSQLAATLQHLVDLPAERGSDLTNDEVTQARTLTTEVAALDERISIFADAQRSNDQHAHLLTTMASSREQREADAEQQRRSNGSLGARFVGAPEFREYQGRGSSSRYWDDMDDMETRAPTQTGGLHLPPDRVTVSEPTDLYPLFGVVSRETISTGAFEYVVTNWVDAAAVVAEGAAKPESTLTETLVPGTLDNIAHWVQITRQALEDSARVRSIIDGRLTRGVLKKVHDSIAAAIAAAAVPTAVNADLLSAIREAAGTVQAAGWQPNAVLLNPADYAGLDIHLMGVVIGGSPSYGTSYWGLRPVASALVPAGTAYVGDYTEAVTLFQRSGVGIYVSDSHASTFTSNVFTILGEQRAKAVVVNPTAMCKTSATMAAAASGGAGSSNAAQSAKR